VQITPPLLDHRLQQLVQICHGMAPSETS
jgi:hypothetical protein